MELLCSLIALVLSISLFTKYNKLKEKQNAFIDYIQKLENRIKQLEFNQLTSKKTEEAVPKKDVEKQTPPIVVTPPLPFIVEEKIPEIKEKTPIVPIVPPVINDNVSIPKVQSEINKPPVYPRFEQAPTKVKPVIVKQKNETWAKLEKQFAENWTGILGSVIMVIGVGFLGIYAALKISALGRFLLISGFAAVLGGLFFYLYKKPDWLKLALWLRSSAGAIFLFACAGSIAIPGLKWIENESLGLTILSLGVAVNLFLGYIGGKQGFASLHVLLSLVAVWVIPSSPTLLIVGAIVTLFGVALTYREKWDYHLLFTISCFFVFHLLYWLSLNHVVSSYNRILGIVIVLIVGASVALVHYREVYSTKRFEKIPFSVHLINWFYFGIGLYLYSNGNRISTLFLAAGSIVAFILAKRAKKLDIKWLYHTDTLIAQITAIFALLTLFRWELDESVILAAIFTEGLLFLFIAQKENDAFLYKIGCVTLNLIGATLLIYGLVMMDYSNYILLLNQSGAILASAILGTIFLFHSNKTNEINISGLFRPFNIRLSEKTKHPILGIIVGALFVSYFIHVYEYHWSVYAVIGILIAVLFLRNKLQSVELGFTSIVFLIGTHIVNWFQLYHIHDQAPLQLVIVGLPILAASLLSIRYSFVSTFSKHLNWIGVYLFFIQLALICYYLLNPISDLLVGCSWLLLSLISLLIVKLISKRSLAFHYVDRYILHAAYVLVGLFLIRHLIFDLSFEELWGPLKGRIWVELFAFIVFTIWAIIKKAESSDYKTWKYLHPLFLELVVFFSFLSVSYELNYSFLPLAWLGMAGIILILSKVKGISISRINVYSFVIFLFSVCQEIYIYFNIYAGSNNSSAFPEQAFILASVFIVLSIAYLVSFYKYAELQNVTWPYLLKFLNPLSDGLYNSAAFIGIYFYSTFILLITYFMFVSVSPIIPGVIWLVLSAVAGTLSLLCFNKRFNFKNVDRYLLHMTYVFIASFLIRHVLVHIQLETYIGIFKTRFLIELLALAVFSYCATLRRQEDSTYKTWDYLHPLFIELIIVFSIFTIALEVDGIWQPLVWITMSFVFALLGNSKYEKLSRLLFYSIIMYWVAALQTAFVTSSYVIPSKEVYAQPWIYGTISILLQFAFLIYFYLKCSFEKIVLPRSLLFLEELIHRIQQRRNVFVFYPLILCTAVFLFWTFDRSVLTLLWVVECLTVFVISLVLKEQHFRYIALGALAVCIVRLIFYDLSQASTLSRAIVFLGVGIIMLLMNSLYNKFKTRFE